MNQYEEEAEEMLAAPRPKSAVERELYDEDPDCEHEIQELWSGIKCKKCPGWFCL